MKTLKKNFFPSGSQIFWIWQRLPTSSYPLPPHEHPLCTSLVKLQLHALLQKRVKLMRCAPLDKHKFCTDLAPKISDRKKLCD